MMVNNKEYQVIENVYINGIGGLPVLNIPMMTDECWNEIARKQVLERESISFLHSVIQGSLSLVCCCVFAKLAVKGDRVDRTSNESNDREAA